MAKPITYSQAGVDIDANERMVELISAHVQRTHGPRVIHLHNAFAGLFRLDYDEKLFKKNFRSPVLVACTDGVGTKIKVAALMNRFDTVGIDLVAMCVNDMLVQGAEPLFFLDYIAVNTLKPEQINQFVAGISEGCLQAECALLGGETAEMPDVYRKGEFDLAGFAVGVVEKNRIVAERPIEPGDSVMLADAALMRLASDENLTQALNFADAGLSLDRLAKVLSSGDGAIVVLAIRRREAPVSIPPALPAQRASARSAPTPAWCRRPATRWSLARSPAHQGARPWAFTITTTSSRRTRWRSGGRSRSILSFATDTCWGEGQATTRDSSSRTSRRSTPGGGPVAGCP